MLTLFVKKKRSLLRYTAVIAIVLSLLALSIRLFQLSPAHATSNTSIVFVHGIEGPDFLNALSQYGSGDGGDCQDYWGAAENYIRHGGNVQSPVGVGNLWGGDLRTVGYYNGDKRCDVNLHDKNQPYNQPSHEECTHYANGNEGTNNESLFHISCLFAWYLYDNFGQKGLSEILIGHSMGGLIIRETIYQVQNRTSLHTGDTFPSTIGHVTEAITANTPHLGVDSVRQVYCLSVTLVPCQQLKDMSQGSLFMNELESKGQDPQAGGTDWTLIGSTCDTFTSIGSSAVAMDGANHIVVYDSALGNPNVTCYDHGGAIRDTGIDPKTKQYCDLNGISTDICSDAPLMYCDTNNIYVRDCANPKNWVQISNGPYGLLAILQVITSNGYSPVLVMQNPSNQ